MSLSADISTFREGDRNPLGDWYEKACALEVTIDQLASALREISDMYPNERGEFAGRRARHALTLVDAPAADELRAVPRVGSLGEYDYFIGDRKVTVEEAAQFVSQRQLQGRK